MIKKKKTPSGNLSATQSNKIEKRMSRVELLFERLETKMNLLVDGFASLDKKIDDFRAEVYEKFREIDERFREIDERFREINGRFSDIDDKIGVVFDELHNLREDRRVKKI